MAENDNTQQSNPIRDLFVQAIERNHVGVQDAFDRAISQKISASLEDYKKEMAASLFDQDDSEEESSDEEQQAEGQEEEDSDEQTDQ